MKQTEEYYYGRMPKDKQNVYRAVLHGLMELSDEFLIPQVPTTDGNWLYDVFFQLRLDHPEIFWAVGFKYRYYKDSPNLILIPEYIFDKNKIREHQKALGARVDKLVRTAMKFSEWDKEKYVHDFICENIRYDKLKKPYSHEIIGPLGHGVGVCEGIAKSVKVLCDALGVWCIIAICGNNPEKGIKYRHTWNIVRINGQYYHLDATFDNTLGKMKKPYSHEIIGPLGHGVGVCEGIAKSVKVLCDALGVWCIIAICGNNPEKGIKYRHTWNIVRINGQYYHLDATFDNTLGKNEDGSTSIRYDYFNLDDKNIFRDHEPLIAPAPPCPDGNHFYYREKKLSFTKLEDVYKRALQAAKKGREFTFHWRGGYLTRGVLADLVDQIQAAGKTRDKKAIITLNWPQAVLRFHFAEQQAEGKVFIEEVNEGEKL